MAEMVLPGTYIDVRPEGLIVPARVSVGTVAVVGTARKGELNKPVAVGGFLEAREIFGAYDPWVDGRSNELTLVRAIEIAAAHGATSIIAVRVSAVDGNGSPTAAAAAHTLRSADGGDGVVLTAKSPGTWSGELGVQVVAADSPAFVGPEKHTGATSVTLQHTPVGNSARNRVQLFTPADGVTRSLSVLRDDTATPQANEVKINRSTGALTFAQGFTLKAEDVVTAWYEVAPEGANTVVLSLGRTEERYTVVNGDDLVTDIGSSAWVDARKGGQSGKALKPTDYPAAFGTGTGNTPGSNGEATGTGDTEYKAALDLLLNEDAHIIVGAGRSTAFADELGGHCQLASSDAFGRDRIAVVGAELGTSLDVLRGHNIDSDRVVLVAPGITFGDAAAGTDVTLPGAYAAAAVAGLLASYPPHVSLTNKALPVGDLEVRYTRAQLTQLVQARILALEARQGFRVVQGITTSGNTAWKQITTRRIVDYAKFGVRAASTSYIGLLNNERVRTALRTTIASFLNEMVDGEMLISYDLDVTATREQQRKGIVAVTLILRPTFSIDFIEVTIFLE
ncbi:phage tail sheath C-terminal domain-containing protein [Frankia sp. CiP1_Cm_nod2]|uniref:phage tail sheath C-terminal domain-containing protein n=1 Tax=Frankia sp. CiP1_Cm_nod2 TaxID=2897161 RepID=UPI0020252AC5